MNNRQMRERNRKPNQLPNNKKLSPNDMQIALSFLKKRFPQYNINEIMLSLVKSISNKDHQPHEQQRQRRYQAEQYDQDMEQQQQNAPRTRFTRFYRDERNLRQNIPSINMANQERLNKEQEIRLVASTFCNVGVNFKQIQYFFPDMSAQKYRSYLETINNQIITDIQTFLRYEHNVQVEQMSTEQKRSLKSQLLKVRQWLGPKSVSQLQTYFKFVQRHYQRKNIEIEYSDALKLYKTFLELVKSPFVDVMQISNNQTESAFTPPPCIRSETNSAPLSSFTKQEQKTIIQFFIKFQNIQKISQKLFQTRGQSQKWKSITIDKLLRYVLKKSIKKMKLCQEKYLIRSIKIIFKQDDEFVNKIFERPQHRQLLGKLFLFYMNNKTTITGLTKMIMDLNEISKNNSRTRENEDHQLQISMIPKIQFEQKQEESRLSNRNARRNRRMKNPIQIDLFENEQQVNQEIAIIPKIQFDKHSIKTNDTMKRNRRANIANEADIAKEELVQGTDDSEHRNDNSKSGEEFTYQSRLYAEQVQLLDAMAE